MNNRKSVIAAALALSVLGQAAVAQSVALPSYRPKIDGTVVFPAPERAARKAGAFVAPHNVALVSPGMTKKQIYTLLDVPHFYEGFNVRRWNYILNFYTGRGDEYVACQYQIQFDAKARIADTYFKDPDCVRFLEPVTVRAVAAVPVVQPPRVVAASPALAASTYGFTFAFDSAAIGIDGMAALRAAADEIRTKGYKEAIVTGFTDTSGSSDYNDALSARRAAAAAEALRDLVPGVPVYARASRDLEVPTGLQTREERNRRVQIELYAEALERPSPTTVR